MPNHTPFDQCNDDGDFREYLRSKLKDYERHHDNHYRHHEAHQEKIGKLEVNQAVMSTRVFALWVLAGTFGGAVMTAMIAWAFRGLEQAQMAGKQ